MFAKLNSDIDTFAKGVEAKFQVKNINKLWKNGLIKANSKVSAIKSDVVTGSKCEHVWKKGAKQTGNCGAPTCKDSVTGKYCKKHLGDEKQKKKKDDSEIIKSINENRIVLKAVRNQYGNYEDKATGYLFNTNDSRAYAKQVGKDVVPFSEKDIEFMKSNKIAYVVPKTIKSEDEVQVTGNILSSDDDMSDDSGKDDDDDGSRGDCDGHDHVDEKE